VSAEPILTSDVFGLTKTAPFSRRGFMTASAAVAAGYTLAAGPVRADVIKTDTEGLDSGDTKIKVADGDMPGYFARPKGASNPPVVLVAIEIFGLHEYIKDVTRRLAKLGAFAVAPDYYFRKGGIIGFCRGGRTVWEYAAHNAGLKAGVAFYGPPVDPPNRLWPKSPTQLAPEMKAPVLGLYGEAEYRHSRRERRSVEGGAGRKQEGCGLQDLSGRPRTASTPIIARATARRPPRMPGIRCRPGSRNTTCWADRHDGDAAAREVERPHVAYWQTWTVRRRRPWRVCTRRRTR